jgi:DNA-binding response OmpR family regulator
VASKVSTEAILIAEDDDGLRKLTSTIRSQHGYRVVQAVEGQDEVAKFVEKRERISLIILDSIMTKKNGGKLMRRFRSEPLLLTLFC